MSSINGQRYSVAKAMGEEAFKQAVDEDEELLREFGLKLLSVDCGVQAAAAKEVKGGRVNPWSVIHFGGKEWNFVRALLLELKQLRVGVPAK